MNRRVEAKINWLTEGQGGRKEIPYGDKYAPIIKLTKPLFESDDFWSVFVINKTMISQNETISCLYYLSDMAPDNLWEGVEFMLCEGPKTVARGVVLREVV